MLSKKEMEQCALDATRKAGAPIPTGELEGEEPDFRFQTPPLGIDVSELVRPACTNYGILPLEQERFRQKILDSVRQECVKRGISSIYVHVCQTARDLVESTTSWANHRSDTKLREERLTRMQCRPSHGRSRRPSQPTSNLTLIASGQRNFCLSTGRRYKGCRVRAEFPHTLS